MATTIIWPAAHLTTNASNDGIAARELQETVIRALAIWTMFSGFVALAFLYDGSRLITWLPAIALSTLGLIIYRLARLHCFAGSLVWVTSIWLILTLCLPIYPQLSLAPLYSLIVVAAAFLLRAWTTWIVAAASILLLGIGALFWPALPAFPSTASDIFMICTALLLSWLIARTLTTALAWGWVAYTQAEEKMADAQSKQAELGRVTKSLNETLDSLESLTRRLAEARSVAEQAMRQKAEIAAWVSHELRTPLNIVVGFAELLARAAPNDPDLGLSEEKRAYIEAIYRNASHISSFVDDILELSQIDARRMALHKESTSIHDVVEEAVAAVVDLFKKDGLYVRTDLAPDLPSLLIDRTRIREVLINLLANARRFTDEGGAIIRAWRRENEIILAVTDTGIGIPEPEIPKVFQDFQQLTQTRLGGTGLGLSICKRLVELHGGNVWVESVINEGSTFYLSLPLTTAVVATAPVSRSLQRGTTSITARPDLRTLVVVDGDGRASKLIDRYLDGYRVQAVADLAQAKPLVAAGQATALLLCADTGLAELKTLDERLPLVRCPFRASQPDLHAVTGSAYLTKPVSIGDLSKALERLAPTWQSVIVIEDHPEMGKLLAEMLRQLRSHADVRLARDGQTGFDLLTKEKPDIVLLDLLMPALTGYDLLQLIRTQPELANLPTLVITGAEDQDERIQVEQVVVSRVGGLSVAEAMDCLKSGLDALLNPPDGTDEGQTSDPPR